MLLFDGNYLRLDGKVQFVFIDDKKMIFSTRQYIYTIIGHSLQIKEYSLSSTVVYGNVNLIGVEYV